jgi:O-antigen ligase
MISTTWNNNYFKYTFWSLIIADIFFFYAHTFPKFEIVFFIITCLALFYLMLKKSSFIVYIPLLELFIGSQGHLMDLNINGFTISFRLAIFILAFLAGIRYLLKKRRFDFLKSSYLIPVLIYLGMLILGIVLALLNNREVINIFFDLNGYLFIFIVPIFYQIAKDQKIFKNLLYIFLAASFFFSVKTILSFYIFSHRFPGINLTILYEWLRDSRIGEITIVNPSFFRIFFQSQIYILISFIITFCLLAFKRELVDPKDKKLLITLNILNLVALLISLSRSYWVGLVVFLFILFIWLAIKKYKFLNIVKVYLKFIAITVASVFFIFLLVKVPYTDADLDDLFAKRLTSGEAASNSRLELLPHMLEKIKNRPLLGNGLAPEITYMSHDPRNRNEKNPDGTVTTYSFEWGWLSIWMKFGILGLLAYLYLILKIVIDSVKLAINKWPHTEAILIISLALCLITISTVHFFSPYLDHPLGLGFLIITICLIEKYKQILNIKSQTKLNIPNIKL